MNEDNNQNIEEEYDLYTEKIVELPVKKYKRAIKLFKYIVLTIMLSLVAGLVFYYTVKFLRDKEGSKAEPTKPNITIPYVEPETKEHSTDETEETTGQTQKNTEEASNTSLEYKAIKLAENAYKSLVIVQALKNTSQLFGTMYEVETTGVCIVRSDNKDYIITQYDVIKDADIIYIRNKNGKPVNATFIAGDSVTNVAIICVEDDAVFTAFGAQLTPITMGNTGFISNMNEVVAVGNVCNGPYSMNYGMVTNTNNVVKVIDMCYSIVNTNISSGNNPSGILINGNGEMIGLITNSYAGEYGSNLISAYGVSNLRSLFEQLINKKDIVYVGIEGNEVTNAISEANGLPRGVYITDILANSPAYASGLQIGDIIVKIEDTSIETFFKYRTTLFKYVPGDSVTFTVARRNKMVYKEITIEVVLQ